MHHSLADPARHGAVGQHVFGIFVTLEELRPAPAFFVLVFAFGTSRLGRRSLIDARSVLSNLACLIVRGSIGRYCW